MNVDTLLGPEGTPFAGVRSAPGLDRLTPRIRWGGDGRSWLGCGCALSVA
jgi:hypothetical protein